MRHAIDWKKYFFAFAITAVIFATAMYASNYFNQKKIAEIRSIQDQIAIDILSSETQFTLLEESSCTEVSGGSVLSRELGDLEEKLASTEKDRGADDPAVLTLKRYYSLLEIKDYILMQKIAEKCKKTPVSIIYLYSTDKRCPDCEREGYVLTHLRETYPELRVYSFDYDINLSAVKTLISINKVQNELPALIINGKAYYGFQSVETLEALPSIKALKDAQMASSTANNRLKTSSTTTDR
jgi:hypothetical protein